MRLALEIGLYQLRFLTRVPAAAAVNESGEFRAGVPREISRGFVNAVLRRATREPEFDPVTALSDPLEKLSIETSHPSG